VLFPRITGLHKLKQVYAFRFFELRREIRIVERRTVESNPRRAMFEPS
jgi:hypothetical protein